jgi:hypothetical protein
VLGDFFQLPAVAQKALFYNEMAEKDEDVAEQVVYRAFNKMIELDIVRRQEGTDDRAVKF